jgi:hypothetical protein
LVLATWPATIGCDLDNKERPLRGLIRQRTSQALQDQHRLHSLGAVRRAGQVNVAQNQINVFRDGEGLAG